MPKKSPSLEKKINNLIYNRDLQNFEPIVFDLNISTHEEKISKLIERKEIIEIVDDFSVQQEELALIKNPTLLSNQEKLKKILLSFKGLDINHGKWVFYPWRRTLVHLLDSRDFQRVKTSRNLNLILPQEQQKFEKAKIGIAGLNVGNPAAICLALEGVGEIKLADIDPLSLSNLNRFRAGVCDLGLNKVTLSARQIKEINPFSKLSVFFNGIVAGRTEEFLLNPKIDVLVEEMDNLRLKLEIREKARKNRIPVVMVTGNGPNVIIDIERFDKNPNLKFLSGYLKEDYLKRLKTLDLSKLKVNQKVLLARDFMGARYLTKRLQDSFLLVGSKLAGIPQLAESSFLRGAAVCYFVRQIVLGKNVPSGRYNLNLEDILK
ncbi:MAG: ThiF family adenylyltransferase [Candidatus Paceibacterota bacterium]|jgi:tRNA A37 threonylcarbamoyladenosine dehydratase